jgi:hypothetical protein
LREAGVLLKTRYAIQAEAVTELDPPEQEQPAGRHGAVAELPRLRGDWALPEGRGVIDVTGGGFVLSSLAGMSSLTSGSGVHVMTFQTADAAHGWLNDVIAIGEGRPRPAPPYARRANPAGRPDDPGRGVRSANHR